MSFQLVHNIHILDPLSVPIDAIQARISRAVANLTLKKAVVHGVLHRCVVRAVVEM
jgi:hypothetical protein